MNLDADHIRGLALSDPGLIARALNESEEAKQLLRAKGYGVTGQGIKETVELVLEDLQDREE